jgi:Holliday junction resolvase RusA-like endonuclease
MQQASQLIDSTHLVFDLPRPPSVNRLMARLGNRSAAVERWIRAADASLMSNPAEWRRLQAGAIKGPFEIDIVWSRELFGRIDIDNPIKVLLDYLQRIQLIENDRQARKLSAIFGTAPAGCRVRLRPWNWQS